MQSSLPGEIVADPFFGSGNGLLATAGLNRNAIGTDISEKAHSHLNHYASVHGLTITTK